MKATRTGSALPNFFILGAAKAGTTTLFDLLKQHPQVWLPFDKEPMFFSRDEYFRRGVEWYLGTYFGGAAALPARGEATPHYLYWAEKVSRRIADLYGSEPVRFIVVLRDPAERAHSWYWNMVRDGLEDLGFLDALMAEEKRLEEHGPALQAEGSMRYGYMRGGHYAAQLEQFLRYHPMDSFHILLLDELQDNPQAEMRALCNFLGIDGSFQFRVQRGNAAAMPRSRLLHEALRGRSRPKSLLKRLLPPAWRYRIRVTLMGANLEESNYPEMEAEARQYLDQRFAPGLRSLEKLLGRDLPAWGKP